LVEQSVIDKRLSGWTQPKPNYTKGVLAKFAKLAKSASEINTTLNIGSIHQ
jgi:dihydroxy-acid dehydratase